MHGVLGGKHKRNVQNASLLPGPKSTGGRFWFSATGPFANTTSSMKISDAVPEVVISSFWI